ncbi:thioesterase family [Trichoderma arundinaceum]|uniref:Thioesterase family n=1 Tax=Trichoderma arundinaceum TaxID=490622 RepID=A0A395NZZ7_TRIAR|nr:thioesterase family [Trichoderma arundinaceum]
MTSEAKIPDSLEEKSAIRRLDDKTFAADLSPSFCIGSVPNGGYVATIFMRVAREYLAHKNQPDTIVAHWEYLNRTLAGPAVFVVEEAKPGRSITVLHVSLYQGGLLPQAPWISTESKDGQPKSEKVVVAYLTNRSIAAEKGISLPSGWSLQPQLPRVADFSKLLTNQDPEWAALDLVIQRRVTAVQQLQFYYNRAALAKSGTDSSFDLWTSLKNGEPIKAPSLGFVVDCTAAFIPEMHRPRTKEDPPAAGGEFTRNTSLWYPTLAMNLEVKKALPEEGEQWLMLRSSSKQIHNGRYDVEIIVFDRAGDLVALSHHVAMVVNSEKNTANRAALAGITFKM